MHIALSILGVALVALVFFRFINIIIALFMLVVNPFPTMSALIAKLYAYLDDQVFDIDEHEQAIYDAWIIQAVCESVCLAVVLLVHSTLNRGDLQSLLTCAVIYVIHMFTCMCLTIALLEDGDVMLSFD